MRQAISEEIRLSSREQLSLSLETSKTRRMNHARIIAPTLSPVRLCFIRFFYRTLPVIRPIELFQLVSAASSLWSRFSGRVSTLVFSLRRPLADRRTRRCRSAYPADAETALYLLATLHLSDACLHPRGYCRRLSRGSREQCPNMRCVLDALNVALWRHIPSSGPSNSRHPPRARIGMDTCGRMASSLPA